MSEDIQASPLIGLREKAGLTQEALAEALGVTDHTVRNWEKGRSEAKLTVSQFKALCIVLKCDASELPDSFGPQIACSEHPSRSLS